MSASTAKERKEERKEKKENKVFFLTHSLNDKMPINRLILENYNSNIFKGFPSLQILQLVQLQYGIHICCRIWFNCRETFCKVSDVVQNLCSFKHNFNYSYGFDAGPDCSSYVLWMLSCAVVVLDPSLLRNTESGIHCYFWDSSMLNFLVCFCSPSGWDLLYLVIK